MSSPYHRDPLPPGIPGATDRLWEYEVVEVFLAGRSAYLEIELSPHGHYLVLELSEPRVVRRRLIPIEFEARLHGESRWEGRATLPRTLLPPGFSRYNVYGIHGRGHERRYLARFPVPGGRPDFHRLECFGSIGED